MLIAGMTVKDFQGISILKEVECSGSTLPAEVELLTSLTLFRFADNAPLVYLNSMKQECKTFHEYASCIIDEKDSKKSSVKTLLADLSEGETIRIGCNVSTLQGIGHGPKLITWVVSVYRESKIPLISFAQFVYCMNLVTWVQLTIHTCVCVCLVLNWHCFYVNEYRCVFML